jgi:two-component sensor histidine kinase
MDTRTAWLLGLAVWTALGLLSAVQTSLYFVRDGRPIPWGPVLVDRLADWYTCALFTPLFFALVRSVPWQRTHWWKPLSVQVLAVIVCVPVKYLLYAGVIRWLIPTHSAADFGRLLYSFIVEAMAFGAMFAVIHAVEFNRRAIRHSTQASRLRARLAETRLEVLTAQLQPHFLFNTLHAISTLIHRDPDAADTMLARLGDLLRLGLRTHDRLEVSLAEELRLLESYLEIARVRFQDRLVVGVDVDPHIDTALVPRFMLQPLVENALRHGIGSREGSARVTIRARRSGGRLHLVVEDDGDAPMLDGGGFPREGVGLTNTRERLRELYGEGHALRLSRGPAGGLQVTLDIPFRASSAQPDPDVTRPFEAQPASPAAAV